MPIELISGRGLSQDPIVMSIVDKVKDNPQIFKFLARIFSVYNRNHDSLKDEIYSHIDRIIDSPRLDLSFGERKELNLCIKKVYNLTPKKFNNVRSEVIESVVYFFGPVTKGLEKGSVYIEPILKDEDFIIGETDIKCDFVFFYKENSPMEFIECKSDIGNVIPKTLPFESASRPHRKKIEYLDRAYSYLSDNYSRPVIYFACYNLNYNRELNNLQENWGFPHMNFVNAEEIIGGKVV